MVYYGSSKLYLFGSTHAAVSAQYKHLFFVRGWNLTAPPTGKVSYDSAVMELTGFNLLY